MLYPEKVRKALDERLLAFQELDARHSRDLESYAHWLDQLGLMSKADIEARLEGVENPGALPSEEHSPSLIFPFGHRWTNHEEARVWAFDRIRGVTTLAVDGSQIPPSKDYSYGVAAIQIAWFANSHRADAREYVKDAHFELLSPDLQTEGGEGGMQLTQKVNLRRFEAEVETIVRHMREWGRLDPPPVAFFDGTLVVSFAAPLSPEARKRYVRAVLNLLEASKEYRVPVVGFVDTSLAKDLCTLLAHRGNLPHQAKVNDGYLLQGRMNWGDRTCAFVCGRDHILKEYRYEPEGDGYQREIAFLYLQTTGDGPPARVDIPRWVVQEGLMDYVADVIRCEVIAGTGYPYCFQAADAAAVLSVPDREAFYGEVAAFCERNGMRLRIAPKATSKRRRRV
jgi:hypothetical protein